MREAEQALNAYEVEFRKVTSDPSVDISVISPYVSPETLETERRAITDLREAGVRLVGSATLSNLQFQRYDAADEALTVMVCSDLTHLRVIDAAGADVTPASRQTVQPLTYRLVREDDVLLVDRSDPWLGQDFCAE